MASNSAAGGVLWLLWLQLLRPPAAATPALPTKAADRLVRVPSLCLRRGGCWRCAEQLCLLACLSAGMHIVGANAV